MALPSTGSTSSCGISGCRSAQVSQVWRVGELASNQDWLSPPKAAKGLKGSRRVATEEHINCLSGLADWQARDRCGHLGDGPKRAQTRFQTLLDGFHTPACTHLVVNQVDAWWEVALRRVLISGVKQQIRPC